VSYGIRIRNNAGTLLVSSDFASPVLRDAGTVFVDANRLITVNYTGAAGSKPMCALMGGTHRKDQTFIGWSGNGWTWQFRFRSTSAPGTAVNFWIFDIFNPTNVSGSYGIAVRGADGQRRFTSLNRPLRILDVLTGLDLPAPYNGFPHRNKAIVHGRRSFLVQEELVNTEPESFNQTTVYDTLPVQVITQEGGFDFGFDTTGRVTQNQLPNAGIRRYQYLIIDVTHY